VTTSTGRIRSWPEIAGGGSATGPGTAWSFGNTSADLGQANYDMLVLGVQFQANNVPALDTTQEVLLNVRVGQDSSYWRANDIRAQVPGSLRNDTQVGYYFTQPMSLFFPEPWLIYYGELVFVEVVDSIGSVVAYNGIKLTVMDRASSNSKATLAFNNYLFVNTTEDESAGSVG
jgi:hypothetical protein